MSIDLNHYRRIFWDILKNYSVTSRNGNINSLVVGGDSVDLINRDRDKIIDLKLMGRERLYVKKVMSALKRIESGSFGMCDDCGEEIEENRLKARPTASLCIACKEEQERAEIGIIYHKKSHTLGRTLNSNIIDLPIKTEEIAKEREYLFQKDLNEFRPLER